MRLLQRRSFWLVAAAIVIVALVILALTSSRESPPSAVTAAPTVEPAPAPIVSSAVPALDAKSATILELFNPSDASLTHQLNETELSQRIEQIFVTSFVLVRCDIMDQDAYHDTFRALVMYAQQSNLAADAISAENRVRHIAVSASASYSLVYSRTQCNEPQLPLIADQLKTWREAYLKQ